MNFYEINRKNMRNVDEAALNFDLANFYKELVNYTSQISRNIGEAISPTNEAHIPYVVFALENYARALRKQAGRDIDEVIDAFV